MEELAGVQPREELDHHVKRLTGGSGPSPDDQHANRKAISEGVSELGMRTWWETGAEATHGRFWVRSSRITKLG